MLEQQAESLLRYRHLVGGNRQPSFGHVENTLRRAAIALGIMQHALAHTIRAYDVRDEFIAPDRQGFGASPPLASRERLAGHARALAALIDALDLEPPIVVGHSYGGSIALRLALDRPGLARGYVLLGPATHGDVGPVAWYNHVGAAPVLGPFFAYAVAPIAGPIAMLLRIAP